MQRKRSKQNNKKQIKIKSKIKVIKIKSKKKTVRSQIPKQLKFGTNSTIWPSYKIKSNSLFGKSPKSMTSVRSGVTRIVRSEQLGDVATGLANTFLTKSYIIAAKSGLVFPWVRGIAGLYSIWKVMGMAFEFKSTSGNSTGTTNYSLGNVCMQFDYNSYLSRNVGKKEMSNSEYSVSGKPSQSLMLPLECDEAILPNDEMYVGEGYTNGLQVDRRLEQFGKLTVGAGNLQVGSIIIGELWVHYDLEFASAKANITGSLLSDHYQLDAASTTALVPFGNNTRVLTSSSNLGTTVTGNVITFPDYFTGSVEINYYVNGALAPLVNPTETGTLGAAPLQLLNNNLTADEDPTNGYASSKLVSASYWTIAPLGDGSSPTITFGTVGTLPLLITGADLIIKNLALTN